MPRYTAPAIALALTLGAITFAACGGQDASTPPPAPAAPSESPVAAILVPAKAKAEPTVAEFRAAATAICKDAAKADHENERYTTIADMRADRKKIMARVTAILDRDRAIVPPAEFADTWDSYVTIVADRVAGAHDMLYGSLDPASILLAGKLAEDAAATQHRLAADMGITECAKP